MTPIQANRVINKMLDTTDEDYLERPKAIIDLLEDIVETLGFDVVKTSNSWTVSLASGYTGKAKTFTSALVIAIALYLEGKNYV